MQAGDVLGIVEAAYAVDAPDQEWLAGIAAACQPLLDRGFGVCAFEFLYREGSQPEILQSRMLGMPEELVATYPRVFASMDQDTQIRPFAFGPCTTGSQMMGAREDFRDNPLMQRYAQKFGIYDSLWITAAEPSGFGCGLHAGMPQIREVSRAELDLWGRLSAHLSAGARLRRHLPRSQDAARPTQGADAAVLSPDGVLHHAEGEAKEPQAIARLRNAVVEIERARGPERTSDAERGLCAWKGLVEARWSLVDRFESDGKRYVVARENAPQPPGPTSLTLRERQVVGYAAFGHDNKVIAYELGIAHSTVRVLIARAAAKLGASTRQELLQRYRSESSLPAAAESRP